MKIIKIIIIKIIKIIKIMILFNLIKTAKMSSKALSITIGSEVPLHQILRGEVPLDHHLPYRLPTPTLIIPRITYSQIGLLIGHLVL